METSQQIQVEVLENNRQWTFAFGEDGWRPLVFCPVLWQSAVQGCKGRRRVVGYGITEEEDRSLVQQMGGWAGRLRLTCLPPFSTTFCLISPGPSCLRGACDPLLPLAGLGPGGAGKGANTLRSPQLWPQQQGLDGESRGTVWSVFYPQP